MNTHEAIKILRNTAWLGTHENREKTEQAIEVVAEALEQSCDNDCEHCEWVTCPKMEQDKKRGMNTHEAIKILRNTAWLGTNEDREKTEQAVEVVAEALEQNCVKCKHYFETEDDTGVHSQCRLESDRWK